MTSLAYLLVSLWSVGIGMFMGQHISVKSLDDIKLILKSDMKRVLILQLGCYHKLLNKKMLWPNFTW